MKIRINKKALNENINTVEYPGIDIGKFLASILVMIIHMTVFNKTEEFEQANFMIQQYLTRGAVPFFFICSGFFFFRKIDLNTFTFKNCIGYIKKLIKLYLIWTVIYSFYIVNNVRHGRKTVSTVILEFFFSGSYLHLWYFTALITGIVIVSFMLSKRISTIKIFVTGMIFYFIGLLGQSYYVILASHKDNPVIDFIITWYPKIFFNTRNGLFEGFFFVGMGLIFAKNKIRLPFNISVIGLVISEILVIIETTFIKEKGWYLEEDLFISLIPLCFFMFYVLSHISITNEKHPEIFKHLRTLSSLIFYIHLIVLAVLRQILITLKIAGPEASVFIPVLIITIITSEIIIFLSNKKAFKFLKNIY